MLNYIEVHNWCLEYYLTTASLIAIVASFAGLIFGETCTIKVTLCLETATTKQKCSPAGRISQHYEHFLVSVNYFFFAINSFLHMQSGGKRGKKERWQYPVFFVVFYKVNMLFFFFRWKANKAKICSVTFKTCSLKNNTMAR